MSSLSEALRWRLRQPNAAHLQSIACASARLADSYKGVFRGPLILAWPASIDDDPAAAVKVITALSPLSSKTTLMKLCGWAVTPALLAEITSKLPGVNTLHLSGCKMHGTAWQWLQAQGHHWRFPPGGDSKSVTIQIRMRAGWQKQ